MSLGRGSRRPLVWGSEGCRPMGWPLPRPDRPRGRPACSRPAGFSWTKGLAPFSGLYEIENTVIVCAHHYFTPPDTLVQIGIVG